MVGGIEKSRGLRELRQKSEDRLKAEEARQGTVEKSSFSWRLSSKSTSTHHIASETICSGSSALLFASTNTIVFIHLLRSFLRSLHLYRVVWVTTTFYKVRDFPASMRTCILWVSLFPPFLSPSLSFSFSSSLLYRATGLNHCFLSLSYSRRSADSALHSNCCSSRLIPCIVRRTIAIISSLDASRSSSLRIRFRCFRLICFDVRTRSLMKMPLFTRLCYKETYDIVRDSLQRLVCSMSILIYIKSRETDGYMISKFGECFSDTNW